jgi:hypothetical protein
MRQYRIDSHPTSTPEQSLSRYQLCKISIAVRKFLVGACCGVHLGASDTTIAMRCVALLRFTYCTFPTNHYRTMCERVHTLMALYRPTMKRCLCSAVTTMQSALTKLYCSLVYPIWTFRRKLLRAGTSSVTICLAKNHFHQLPP